MNKRYDCAPSWKHWEHVADLAHRMNNHPQAAAAYEQLGQLQLAAAAYERAAQHASAEMPLDEERVAMLYEHAAQLYLESYDEQHTEICYKEVRRYRRIPEMNAVHSGV